MFSFLMTKPLEGGVLSSSLALNVITQQQQTSSCRWVSGSHVHVLFPFFKQMLDVLSQLK